MYGIIPPPGIIGRDMCYVCSLQIKDYCTEHGYLTVSSHGVGMFFGGTGFPIAVMFALCIVTKHQGNENGELV